MPESRTSAAKWQMERIPSAKVDQGSSLLRYTSWARGSGWEAAIENGSTGLLTYNSLFALGALYELAVRGVKVPEDFSVASGDRIAASGIEHPVLTVLTGLTAPVETIGPAGRRR